MEWRGLQLAQNMPVGGYGVALSDILAVRRLTAKAEEEKEAHNGAIATAEPAVTVPAAPAADVAPPLSAADLPPPPSPANVAAVESGKGPCCFTLVSR